MGDRKQENRKREIYDLVSCYVIVYYLLVDYMLIYYIILYCSILYYITLCYIMKKYTEMHIPRGRRTSGVT